LEKSVHRGDWYFGKVSTDEIGILEKGVHRGDWYFGKEGPPWRFVFWKRGANVKKKWYYEKKCRCEVW
jgi:hypothetical protein